MVLTVSFVLSPVIGLFCHRRLADTSARLERQRRGVRTTRLRRPRQHDSSSAPTASTASRPASVTIAIRPSVGRDGGGYRVDLGQTRTEIFLQMGLDRKIASQPVGQISRPVCWATLALSPSLRRAVRPVFLTMSVFTGVKRTSRLRAAKSENDRYC